MSKTFRRIGMISWYPLNLFENANELYQVFGDSNYTSFYADKVDMKTFNKSLRIKNKNLLKNSLKNDIDAVFIPYPKDFYFYYT